MNRFFKYSLLCCLMLLPLWVGATTNAAGTVVISQAKLRAMKIIQGDTTTMHVVVVQPKGAMGKLGLDATDSISRPVDIGEFTAVDTVDLGNGKIQITADLIVQSFDSGEWHVQPVFIVEADTVRYSDVLLLRVDNTKVDAKGEIKPYAPVEEPDRKALDWVPDVVSDYWWAWLLGVLLLAGVGFLIFAYYKWWRKGKNPFKFVKKRKPPFEEAMERLQLLKAQQLWQNGQEKDYYTGLTDILREYIDRRFNINAVEMTSTQIIDALHNHPETQLVNEQLSQILEVADFVKFAGERPLADDNERSFQRALNFVEETKPSQQEVEAAAAREKEEAAKNTKFGKLKFQLKNNLKKEGKK